MCCQVKIRSTALDIIQRFTQLSYIGIRPVLLALMSSDSISLKRDNAHHMSAVLSILVSLSKAHGMTSTRLSEWASSPLNVAGDCVPLRDALDIAAVALQHRDKTARRAALKVHCNCTQLC